jgi:hypothetical protein
MSLCGHQAVGEAEVADCDMLDQAPGSILKSQRQHRTVSRVSGPPGVQEQVSPGSILGGGGTRGTPL